MRAGLLLALLLPLAAAAKSLPVKVKVLKVDEKQPCKCERAGEVAASKIKSARCFVTAEIDPKQPIEPFSKMFLVMNQVRGQSTLVKIPDATACDFKKGKTTRLWNTDIDPDFLESTPNCGHEPADYAETCEPYGRFVTLYRNESLRAAPPKKP